MHGEFFSRQRDRLAVPGLAEGKPSVLVGDTVLVQLGDSKWRQGLVHRLEAKHVLVRFSDKTSPLLRQSGPVNVHFKLNRLPFRRCHHAVSIEHPLNHILFPEGRHRPPAIGSNNGGDLAFFNRAIGNNDRQKSVVHKVLSLSSGSPPLLVHGPCVTSLP